MNKFALLFLSLISIKFSEQVRVNCTKFGQPTPSAIDLKSITWEVKKIQAKYNVPILAEYENEEDMGKDLLSYTQGMNNEDAQLTLSQIVTKYGFKLETHNNIKTKDGYLLTLHRLRNEGNHPVFINHGLFGSSIDWFLAGQESLPFVLAGLGYDVWLGNFRGNKYSTRHESWTLDCAQYWDFSWDEFGNYDLPASIDYITRETEQRKLSYIGHSVGTTAFFVLTSLRPEYNDKISSMVAMSPMAWTTNIKSPVLRVLTSTEIMEEKTKNAMGLYELTPSEYLTNSLRNVICAPNAISQVLCNNFAFLITGFNERLLNMFNFYTISQKYPAGASTKTLVHYAQNIQSGQFRRYDYPGYTTNIEKYGFVNPPNYPVENVRAKVSFIISENDCLSNVTDVLKLRDRLHNVGDTIYVKDYSSVDYLWATNARTEVYDTVVTLIQKYMSY